MTRRGFLTSCLALAAAPAIVRADALMRIVPPSTDILLECDWFDGPLRPALTEAELKRYIQKIWSVPQPEFLVIPEGNFAHFKLIRAAIA